MRRLIWDRLGIHASHTKRRTAWRDPPRLSNVTVAVLSGRRRDRDRDPGHPCAPAGGFGSLPAGRVTRGAGLARLAAALVHALTGGITGCSGMAGHRAPLLHTLAIVRRRRA